MTPAKTREQLKLEIVNTLKTRLNKATSKIPVALLNLEFAHILDDCELFIQCFPHKQNECVEQRLKKALILEVQKEFEELYGVTIDNNKYRQVK